MREIGAKRLQPFIDNLDRVNHYCVARHVGMVPESSRARVRTIQYISAIQAVHVREDLLSNLAWTPRRAPPLFSTAIRDEQEHRPRSASGSSGDRNDANRPICKPSSASFGVVRNERFFLKQASSASPDPCIIGI